MGRIYDGFGSEQRIIISSSKILFDSDEKRTVKCFYNTYRQKVKKKITMMLTEDDLEQLCQGWFAEQVGKFITGRILPLMAVIRNAPLS